MKNKDILLDVIGDADEKIIPTLTVKKKKSSIFKRTALGSVCAAAVITFMFVLSEMNQNGRDISPYGTLLQISNHGIKQGEEKIKSDIRFGGMGFEGLMAYDISELDTPNPWNSALTLSVLPVYRNLAYNDIQMTVYLSEEQMKEIAQNTASSLNVNVDDTKVTYVKDFVQGFKFPNEIMNSPFSIDVRCSDKTTISVYGDGQIRISFDNQKLPSSYHFSYSSTSKEEAERVLEYLSDKYTNLLHYDNAVCYSTADRSYSGNEHRSYYVYNKSDDVVQDILNFNLSYASFGPDDNGNLMVIWLNAPLYASEYLGDYPIITVEEATELLLNGNYYSTVPTDYIGSGVISVDDIAKAELVYRDNRDEYYQPYYKYYVELDSSAFNMADGLKNYGIFYVPAIDSEYLDDFNPNVRYN